MIQVSSSGWNNLFHYLTNTWQFKQLDSGKTLTSFGVGFRFQSSLFNRLAHVYLEEVAKRMVHVFNQRCHEVYGHLPAPPSKQQQVVANNKDTSNNTPNGKWYHLDIGLNEEGEGLWCCIWIWGLFRVCIFGRIWAFSLWWVCCELESGVLLQWDRCRAGGVEIGLWSFLLKRFSVKENTPSSYQQTRQNKSCGEEKRRMEKRNPWTGFGAPKPPPPPASAVGPVWSDETTKEELIESLNKFAEPDTKKILCAAYAVRVSQRTT